MSDSGSRKGGEAGASGRPPGYPANLQPFPASLGAWAPDKLQESLDAIHQATVTAVQGRIDWYDDKAGLQGTVARQLRRWSLVLVGLGALVPLSAPMLPKIGDIETSHLGYIVITIAGILVGLDNFFGYSESWMRYRLTQAELVRRLAAFRYEWASRLAAHQPGADGTELYALLDLQRRFMDSVEAAVEAETTQWATRQRGRLLSFDRKQEFDRYDAVPGRVHVRVEGWEKLADPVRSSIKVRIGSRPLPLGPDGTATSQALDPGGHMMHYEWTKADGTTGSASKLVAVESDKVGEASIAVPA
ncbi:SLATT domain-containing protein [Thalassobaculum sp.]|uniref:SLATT domain-containing protein n=1 Tax=Thalassobaculum sp. TaxID=2022740 RepID=UPI0032EF481E